MIGTFRHGVHPHDHKDTADLPLERMPFVERYILPLAQHIGAPSKPIVERGQRVKRGQRVAEAAGFVSTTLHSPVDGTVAGIGPQRHPNGQIVPSLEIVTDSYASQQLPREPAVDPAALDGDAFVAQVQQAGLVGLGGAAFPSHVKYALPEGRKIEWLVLNGCECEPFLTSDHRLMVERADRVVRGIRMLSERLGVRGAKIGVELNKLEAIDALRSAIVNGEPIEVVPLKVKYPQGAEKMLIKAVFNEEVPAGKLPLDLGMVVNNVGTMSALADWFDHGVPLIERIVTVAGTGVDRPANLIVPIGTSVREVLRHCGLRRDTRQVVMGGPMMGMALPSLDVPVIKGTSGILAFAEAQVDRKTEYSCVRCGRCVDACANMLNPARMVRLARARRFEEMESQFVMDCMECGACTFACPSGIPIVQLMRVAKGAVREAQQRRKQEEQSKKTS